MGINVPSNAPQTVRNAGNPAEIPLRDGDVVGRCREAHIPQVVVQCTNYLVKHKNVFTCMTPHDLLCTISITITCQVARMQCI